MGSWGKEQQVCATCRYWAGAREIDFSASCFAALHAEGRCNGPDGSFRGCQMGEGSSCSEWETYRS